MHTEYQPLVSIIIPVYKGYPYLKDSIDSALAQTYPNIEVIVINDGSPDDGETERIALAYGDKIRYFCKENGGVSTALNYGIEQMRGEWFSWLSHDDVYLPEKIEKQIDAVAKLENKVCVVRCSTSPIDAQGNPIVRPVRKISGVFQATKMLEMHYLKEVGLYGCSLLIHRDILQECGPFDDALKTVQDEDYWTRIGFLGFRFVSVPDILVKIRIHAGQTTHVLAEQFAPEEKVYTEKVLKYYENNKKGNHKRVFLFACRFVKDRKKEVSNILLKYFKENRPLSIAEQCTILCYQLWGSIYAFIKRLYRKLIIRRYRE